MVATSEFAKRVVIAIGIALVPLLVWYLFDVVLILTGIVLISALLRLGAEPFLRVGIPRPLALLASGIGIICVLGGAGYLFGRGISAELQEVLQRADQARQDMTSSLQGSQIGKLILSHVQGGNLSITELIGRVFTVSAAFIVGVLVTVFGGVYVAAQPTLYRDGITKLIPSNWRENANETMDHLADALRLWLLGQMIQMIIIGLLSGIAVWLIGLPSPFALGVIAGVAEFIPYLGPILSAIPATLVAVTLNLHAVLWTVLAYVLIHQAEGHLVMPLIQRQMVYVPPAVMLLSIVSLTSLFGTVAVIFAAPITVILFVAVNKLYVRDSLGEPTSLPGEHS